MIYNYKSKYTGRALRADSWVPPVREDLTSPEARARQERRRRKERERSSWATQRRKSNDATRAETRAQRLRVGFDGLLEAAMPPFRPFEALDNLGHPGETLFRAKDGPFAALPRIARELERAKARQLTPGTISCKPRRALSLQKLKRPRTTRDLDMDRVEHLLQTTFAQQKSGTVAGSEEKQSRHNSKDRPHTSTRNKRKEGIKPRPNTAFSGLFPSDLTIASNDTNAEVKASDDEPNTEEEKAPSARTRDRFVLDTREQKKFVMCARQGMLSEMKALFRNHGYSGSVNVNALCENGDAPMHAAAASSQVEVLEYLILMKADLKIPNIDGLLPWDILHRSQSAKRTHKFHHRFRRARAMLDEESTFFRAAKLGNLERILWLCECGHATLQDRNAYGMTVLHLAAMACQRRLVSELLELGLDPNATNNIGQTPLDLVPRGKEGRHVRKLLSSIDDEAEQHQGESTPQEDTGLGKTDYF